MSIEIIHQFHAPAGALWEIVGVPDRVDWVPGVTQCFYEDNVRRLIMPGAGQIAERILSLDDENMFIEYSCIESEPALKHHLASMTVSAESADSCSMIWRTEVEPLAVEPFIKQSMEGCLQRIEALLAA